MVNPVTILVTGFGSYKDIGPGSLSYSVVTTLPTYLPATPTSRTPVRIILHPYDIPISYDEVRAIVPRLYDAYEGTADIWLHLGLKAERETYTIERLAHRDGYHLQHDDDGRTLPEDDGETYWAGCPETLETSLPFDDIFTRWRSKLLDSPEFSPELDGVMIRPSNDCGLFICDFIYYSSMAEHWKRKKDAAESDKLKKTPVLFMHVPSTNTQDNTKRATTVTICLLRALAETWKLKTSKKEEGPEA